MNEVKTGDKAPAFTLPAVGPGVSDGTVSPRDYTGKPLVLYFYPKDDTSGCTAEACDFRDNISQFNQLGAQVVGISRDTLASHEKFAKKYSLNFPLASDEDGKVCQLYNTWVEKSMYGRKYMGVDRATFLIDAEGRIAAFWRKVKVKGHVADVAAALKALAVKQAA